MNIFGAITIGVFVFSAVVGARLADAWIPSSDNPMRGLAVIMVALLCGFIAVKLYLAFLSNRAKVHAARQKLKQESSKPDAGDQQLKE